MTHPDRGYRRRMPLTRNLDDATVVITGASSGIGAATAYALARRGADVVLAARSEEALQRVAAHCRELGGRALVVPTDVTEPEAVERLAARAAAEFGRIDGWVNNAAVSAVGLFDEIPVAEFRRVVTVNLLGTAYGTKAALPWLGAAGGGVVVNNASVLAEVAMPYQSAYNATKHGIRGLADTVRQELRVTGRGNISICTVLPATIDTPFFRHAANHSGHELTPPPPVYPPEVVAETIVRLLRRPRREAYAGARRDCSACSGGWRRRWPSGRSAGTPIGPSSGRASGWTAPATSSGRTPRRNAPAAGTAGAGSWCG